MAYEKQNFEKGQILKADHLNHMEDGIESNSLPIVLDTSLKISGAAADSKAVGDIIIQEHNRAVSKETEINNSVVAQNSVIGELQQEIKKTTPTTTVTDSAPWSSKHIVDMLCPPLEETGNPVQCYPVAGYPLGCKVSWEPTQEGSGDPSPDNVRPIKGRDSVTVERCGENLLDIEQCRPVSHGAAYGLTVTVDDTGLIKLSGIPTVTAGGSRRFRVLFTNQVILTKEYKAKAVIVKGAVDSITGILADKSIVMIVPLTPNTSVDVQFRLMYYTGDEPTTYAPYIGQTITLTLPHTIYGGTVDAVTGEGQETWKLVTLDGTENYVEEAPKQYSISLKEVSYSGKCSHFKSITLDELRNHVVGAYMKYTGKVIFNTNFSSLDEFKHYLRAQFEAGTPIQICYTRIPNVHNQTFTATGVQPIPALSGVNTVLTDADSATVTGRADPIKRITDLEDAVASMTNT